MDSNTQMLLVAREVAMDAERRGFFNTAEAMRSVIDSFLSNPASVQNTGGAVDVMQRNTREG